MPQVAPFFLSTLSPSGHMRVLSLPLRDCGLAQKEHLEQDIGRFPMKSRSDHAPSDHAFGNHCADLH